MEKKTNLESFGIWCERTDVSKTETTAEDNDLNEKIDLHVNYWKLPNSFLKRLCNKNRLTQHFSRCIDFGILLHAPQKYKSICLFTPFKVEKKDISDLATTITDKDICCAVFNDNCKINAEGNNSHTKVITNEKEIDVYPILDLEYKVEDASEGTIITLSLPYQKTENLYIRIRIKTPEIKILSKFHKPYNSFLQSAFSRDEILDFRINEYRVLENSLIEKIEKHGRAQLDTIHFLFICSSSEDYVFSSTPFKNCRFLEARTWKKYTKKDLPDIGKEPPLAYHWKLKNKKDKAKDSKDFAILLKTRYQRSTALKAMFYLFVFIAISVGSSLIASYCDETYFHTGNVSEGNFTRDNEIQAHKGLHDISD